MPSGCASTAPRSPGRRVQHGAPHLVLDACDGLVGASRMRGATMPSFYEVRGAHEERLVLRAERLAFGAVRDDDRSPALEGAGAAGLYRFHPSRGREAGAITSSANPRLFDLGDQAGAPEPGTGRRARWSTRRVAEGAEGVGVRRSGPRTDGQGGHRVTPEWSPGASLETRKRADEGGSARRPASRRLPGRAPRTRGDDAPRAWMRRFPTRARAASQPASSVRAPVRARQTR